MYKPLTPALRNDIQNSISEQMQELNTCQNNVYVSMQKEGLKKLANLIGSLPDGYPIPFKEK